MRREANGNNKENIIDLREIVKKIVAKTGGEAGGHMFAAGAIIPSETESNFLKTAKQILIEETN